MNSRRTRLSGILAGTALALLLGGPSIAAPVPSPDAARLPAAGGITLVQDEAAPEGEQPRRRRAREQQAEEQPDGEQKPRERRRREQQAEERPAEGEGGERRSRRERQQQAEEQSGEGEQQPRERRRREQAEQQDEQRAPAARPRQGDEGSSARTQADGDDGVRRPRQGEEANDNQPSQRERRQQQQAEREKRRQEQAAEKQREQQEAEAAKRERQRQQQAEGEQRERQKAEQAQRDQEEAEQQAERDRRRQRQAEQQRQDEQAGSDGQGEETARERPRRNGQEGEDAEQAEGSNRAEGRRPRGPDNAELPPGEAPSGDAEQRDRAEGSEGGGGRRPPREQADSGPPPADDRAAQAEVRPERVESVDAEQGTRRRDSRNDDDQPRERERPRGTDVLREIGDRLILRYNDQVLVESSDRPRLRRNARDVYTEDLPNQRTRETVVRENGVRVVTIRNRYGDVIRRSRITPDGREYVLNYVDEEDTGRVRDWRDPGLDLPPFRPNVPQEDYILDAERAPSAEDYYDFLEKPPVERVERLYSLDEVKRSSRVRQKTRRIDLDTITFDFGSASVPEAQIGKLEGVATAMERLLKENPAETFLIEGHTDAVGSDEANLALSDRRAESVAEALTNVFDIPPENLATQGYGEQYLKVQTSEPERENRRVAIRRITPLVAPVSASAQ